MIDKAIEELTGFWLEQYPGMDVAMAREWAITQIDEAENGEG